MLHIIYAIKINADLILIVVIYLIPSEYYPFGRIVTH